MSRPIRLMAAALRHSLRRVAPAQAALRGAPGLIAMGVMAIGLGASVLAQAQTPVLSASEAAPRLAEGGFVLWMRHATTVPGTGDPADFDLNDCATQRNLSDTGREQSRRIGGAFRAAGIRLDAVAYSRWCRCRETAELAFSQASPEPLLDSVFAGRGDGVARHAPMPGQWPHRCRASRR